MLKKLLFGTAMAGAFCTTSYAQVPPGFQYRFDEAKLTYNDATNARCRTDDVAGAIWSLENDLRAMDDWITKARVGAELSQAQAEKNQVLAWLTALRNKPPCALPDPPVSVIPAGGSLRPILVATDFTQPGSTGVIWLDEQGNQFVAIYDPDGTGRWDGHGAVPPRPKPEDVSKMRSLSGTGFHGWQEEQKTEEKNYKVGNTPWNSDQKSQSSEKQSNFPPSSDGEKPETKSSGDSEHSNAGSFRTTERANTRSASRSGDVPRAIKYEEPDVSREVVHWNNAGRLSGMGDAGMRTNGFTGMHAGGPSGMQLGGFRNMRFGRFGR
jgi:hypothetical protein